MKKPFRIKPCKHPTYKFVVRDKLAGKWRRKFFTTEREAKTYVALKEVELLNEGRNGVIFSPELRAMAQRAGLGKFRIKQAQAFFRMVLEGKK